jgi:hypothetical protein
MREILAVVGVERYRVSVKGLAEVLGRNRVTVRSWISGVLRNEPGREASRSR